MSTSAISLKEVYTKTYEARDKWRNILLALDVPLDTIHSIGTTWNNKADDCYREGLSEWLKGGVRTWRDMAKALSSPIVGYSDLASAIDHESVKVGSTEPKELQSISDNLTIYKNQNIGTGAFGSVFKGSYKGKLCAAKVLHNVAMELQTKLSASPPLDRVVSNFERECKFLEMLRHPNIVQHFSTERHPASGQAILVAELMDCNLKLFLSGHGGDSLTSHCEISISKDIASGLSFIHSKLIIHRDLCGDNILLSIDSQPPLAKISDFGMSRLLDPSELSSTLTAIGNRKGYLPPEALRMDDEMYDYSLDVFSFGVIMVQIVQRLGTIKSVRDRLFHSAQISQIHALKPLINKCLESDKTRRPTAQQLCDLLESSQDVDSEDMETDQAYPPVEQLSLTRIRKGKDMPIRMGGPIQSVKIGNAVYVGGGYADTDREKCTVMKFDLNEWTLLPAYIAHYFAMTSLTNHLVLVGGCSQTRKVNQLAIFESDKWMHPFPSMRVARYFSTAITYKNEYIIVAGGWGDHSHTSSVEILHVTSKQWHTAQPLPSPRSLLKSTLIRNTLYLMGGKDSNNFPTKKVHCVDLDELISKSCSDPCEAPMIWQSVEDTPYKRSTPLSFDDRFLFAVGGYNDKYKASSSIYLYDSNARKWIEVGYLPSERYYCTCIALSNTKQSKEIIVAGGKIDPQTLINTVDILSIFFS